MFKKPKITASTRITKSAKAEVELKADGDKLSVQVEQIGECSPQLYLRRERRYGSSDSIFLNFKTLEEMNQFADYIQDTVAAVAEQRAKL